MREVQRLIPDRSYRFSAVVRQNDGPSCVRSSQVHVDDAQISARSEASLKSLMLSPMAARMIDILSLVLEMPRIITGRLLV